MKKKKKVKLRRFAIKLVLSMVYLVIITILLVSSYRIFKEKKLISPWEEVHSTDEYSYVEVSKMSEKFAYYESENIGLHFIIEEKETGEWHTYVIAINEDKYDDFKNIIDYSYERTTEVPEPIVVYGYPTIMTDDLKEMVLNHIGDFLPADSEVTITRENIDAYLTNSYLDTTKEQKEYFSVILFTTLLLLFIMIALLIFTIFDRDKIVDNIEEKVESLKNKETA
ncbi:MAG: hypothetical protein Q4E69_04555 [Bacilli bacterium]|nr:hypothetical protein [Bacilli bacterium]